jgi:hypothetical protein
MRTLVPRLVAATAMALGAVAIGSPVRAADPIPSIDARTWRPSTDPQAGLAIEHATTPGPGNWSVGAWTAYAHQPITLRRAGTDDVAYRPIEGVWSLDLVANVGLGSRAAIGLGLPTFLYQDGSSSLPSTVHLSGAVPTSGIGDLAIHGKGTIVSNENGGLGLALLGNLTLPTGNRASFMGEGAITVGARLLAEYSLLIAGAQVSAGYHMRPERRTWPDAAVGGYRHGDVLPWSIGFWFRPKIIGVDEKNRQRWELALHGALPIEPVGPFGAGEPGSAALTPALLALSDRVALGKQRDAFFIGGAEIGLTSAIGVPAFRIVLGIGWGPREHDMDHDGVPDDVDQCPEIPEDKDGFEDADGCPEVDNDDDGILDKEDACPNVKGVETKDPKTNGCPADQDSGDDLPDRADACPDQAEDMDGFQDADGCPDPDNDGDGVPDVNDACPNKAGEPSTDPARNGCPNVDRDGDTFENDVDRCPDVAEVFNGVDDEDGCPDEGGKPLAVIDPAKGVRLDRPIKFVGSESAPEVDPASVVVLRAIALDLHRHRDWTLAIGAKPGAGAPTVAQQNALARAFAVVSTIARLAKRDGAAETVGWDAVKAQADATSGLGFLVLVAPAQPAAKPMPLTPAKP